MIAEAAKRRNEANPGEDSLWYRRAVGNEYLATMLYALKKLYHPEFYQGPRRPRRYFEGWYYKTVCEDRAFAIIPGVSRAPSDPHAFVQFLDGRGGSFFLKLVSLNPLKL